jgi:hypothetical protein
VLVTKSNSIAIASAIGHWSISLLWRSGGSNLLVRDYCPHSLQSPICRLRQRTKEEKEVFAGITCPPGRVPRTPAKGGCPLQSRSLLVFPTLQQPCSFEKHGRYNRYLSRGRTCHHPARGCACVLPVPDHSRPVHPDITDAR